MFKVICLRSEIKHSSSRKLVQPVPVFGLSLCSQHKDFIASFRIVFSMKCRPNEDVGMYFGLETRIQGKQPPGNSLPSYLFLVTKQSFGEAVVSQFSLYHLPGVLWIMTFTMFDQQCFHLDFKTFQERLKPTSLCKFTAVTFVLR